MKKYIVLAAVLLAIPATGFADLFKKKRSRYLLGAGEQTVQDPLLRKMEAPKKMHDKTNTYRKNKGFVYPVPAWPVHVAPFEDRDKIEVGVVYQHAGSSFSSGGHTQDLTKLVFGECPIYVRDVLLVSKLVEQGVVEDYSSGLGTGGYLGAAAATFLCFDGSIDNVEISFSCARHFRKNDITCGFKLPFVIRKHNLKLTTTSCTLLQNNDAFKAKYGDCFNDFVKDFLCAKKMRLTEGDTEAGLGDMSVFINFEIQSKHFDRMVVGARALFPTAKERNTHKLWDPELGNGGFTELSAFASVLFSTGNLFNPHILVQAVYCLPAEVNRRIPSWRKYTETDTGAHELGNLLALGELIRTIPSGTPGTTDFEMLDTTFRRFATETERIRIRKGAEFNLRVGNIFQQFIADRGFFDIFYDLRLKGADYLNTRNLTDSCLGCLFAPDILKENTYQVEHRAGLNLSYQFDEHVRTEIGSMYTFAGRNVPKTLEFNWALMVEF